MRSASSLSRGVLVTVACAAAFSCVVDREEDAALQRQPLGALNVLTRNNNNARTGVNLQETILSTSNVNANSFGKVFELSVDDQIFAGLLYASDVSVAGVNHNVVYAATVNNTVYAFDADTGGAALWQRNFNEGFVPPNNTQVGHACGTNADGTSRYSDMSGNIGIVGTPVIDASTLTMYLVTRTYESGTFRQRIRALDIATGNERASAQIIGTINPQLNNQHASLALSQGKVYVAWASHCDTGSYHGRVLAFNASDLAQVSAFDAVPTGTGAGIWMSGAGPIIDASGNLFYATGNGSVNHASNNFGESILKLSPTLGRVDFFMASNADSLNSSDSDLGSSGPVQVPGTNLLVMGGKGGGICYVVDMNSMGGQVANDTQIRQKWLCADPENFRPGQTHHLHNSVVAWQSPAGLNVYTWAENDFGRAWRFNGTTFDIPAVSISTRLPPLGMPGGMMAISASGSTAGTGILWASMPLTGDANQNVVPGVLRAFDAENLTNELWNSSTIIGDGSKNFSKGAPPLIANGRVYVASLSKVVSVYGLRSPGTNPDRTEGGTATGTATACNATTETVAKLYDNAVDTKWCLTSAPTTAVPISTVYDFAGTTAFAINTYTITTGNDAADRDPRSWTFQGCQGSCVVGSDAGWVTLDTRTNQFVGAARFETTTYTFTNTTAYQQYRLRMTANAGSTNRFQMAEIQMFDGGGCTPESDAAFCTRLGANCGALTATDNCGVARSVTSCGTCALPETCGGGGAANTCGVNNVDRTESGTATGTGSACNANETVAKAYDNLMTSAAFSKWCVLSAPSATTPISTMYDFAGATAFVVARYTITTGNDAATRDPRSWTFQGCQGSCTAASDAGWVTLDTRSNEFSGAGRYQTNSYTFSNTTAYQQYRLRITQNNGATNRLQVAELQLF